MWTEILLLLRYELVLTIGIFVLLFLKISNTGLKNETAMAVVNGILGIGLVLAVFSRTEGNAFGDMFITNDLIHFEKAILFFATLMVSMQAASWIKQHEHAMEFYLLMLATLLGMCFMISAGNFLIFYLGLELSTIPLAAMVNFNLREKRSSEGAFKMIIMASTASAFFLFGLSWLYGTTGSIGFDAISQAINGTHLQQFALILIIAGFAFKISAAPFHLWTADVYEGAPIAVTAYLSVVSKGSVLFAMIAILMHVFEGLSGVWYQALVLLSIATMIIGNLFALRQQNMKRFLAFSSVAQVGFILVAMIGQTGASVSALVFFVLVYLFSNLAAFGVVGVIAYQTGKERIDEYAGLYKTNPALAWIMAIALFSLAGIPPTAGFFGKFFLLMAGSLSENWVLLIIAALNMIIALYYYLRVVKSMFMDEAGAEGIPRFRPVRLANVALYLCVAGIIATGLYGGIYEYIFSLVK